MALLIGVLFLVMRDDTADMIKYLRDSLAFMALLSPLAIRLGISSRGIEKLGFTVPWQKIGEVHIEPYQTAKIMLVCKAGRFKVKLIFPYAFVQDVMSEVQKHCEKIYLHNFIWRTLLSDNRRIKSLRRS
jgi:hypothetical protein